MHGADVLVGALLQAVLEHGLAAVAPAPDGTDVGWVAANIVEGAGEDAVPDGGGRCQPVAHDTTCIVGADVECGVDGAALYQVGAIGKAHEAGRVAAVRLNGAADGHVTDGGVLDVAEWCHTSLTRVGIPDIGRQRVALAEEGAAEGLALVHTHHIGNLDVGRQLHVLAAVVLALGNVD